MRGLAFLSVAYTSQPGCFCQFIVQNYKNLRTEQESIVQIK